MSNLRIKYRNVSELIPYARNSRTHSEDQVAQIASSIKQFGWTNPILLNENDIILAGHGRVMAANYLGIEKVPTVVIEGLSEDQVRAYVIADNKLALNAGWDEALLRSEIALLDGTDLQMETGFSIEELEELLADGGGIPDPEGASGPSPEGGDLLECPSCGYEWQA